MTTHDPSNRDELVAAYIDGEASDDERAAVEADQELLARVVEMRQVAALVAAPVSQPPTALKDGQIASALAVSATATNVTSLAGRRGQQRLAKLASVAAVIIIVLAVPIILLNSGSDDDEDVATSAVNESAEETAAGDDGSSSLSAPQPAQAQADGPASGEADAAPAAEPLAEAETDLAESSLSGTDDRADQSGGASDDAGAGAEEELDERAGSAEPLSTRVKRLDIDEVPDLDSLSQLVLAELDDGVDESSADDAAAADGVSDLGCVEAFMSEAGPDGQLPDVMLTGAATVDGELVEYATVSTPEGLELVVFDESCGQLPPITVE
ncbi:MAG: hypothetical protein ACR2PK_11695 [Acidimicrobiales bacterium]